MTVVSGRAVTAPQFRVIITCHNQALFIEDAVNSALAENYKAPEVIVVDDAIGETPGQVTFVEYENLIQNDRMHIHPPAC